MEIENCDFYLSPLLLWKDSKSICSFLGNFLATLAIFFGGRLLALNDNFVQAGDDTAEDEAFFDDFKADAGLNGDL